VSAKKDGYFPSVVALQLGKYAPPFNSIPVNNYQVFKESRTNLNVLVKQ